jgi:3'-5' exoribonuclease
MKSPTVADLRAGKASGGLFLVQSKDVREGRTGRKYMSLTLMDNTGEIDARMWDNVESVSGTFERDNFVRVEGETQEYQGKTQLIVHRLKRAADDEADLKDFLPASRRDSKEMFSELRSIIAGLRNEHLKALLEAIFADQRIAEAFRTAPAAKSVHHAWLGGLIEHVLSLCALARKVSEHYIAIGYPVDADLVISGAILHDLGKIEELHYERSFGYSTNGQLLGHIIIGSQMIEEKLRTLPDFPPKLRALLQHMILSHHGQLDYGSPKVPLFLEALLLAQIDNLDSKMATMYGSVLKERDSSAEWAPYNPALERQVLDKETYLSGRATQEPPPEPSAPRETPPPQQQQPRQGASSRPKPATTALGSALSAALDDPPGVR